MNYEEAIRSTLVTLVEFYASWCPHCQRMEPVVEKVSGELKGTVDVHRYEIDDNQALADREDMRDLPTFIVYRGGEEMWRQSGEMTAAYLLEHVKKYL